MEHYLSDRFNILQDVNLPILSLDFIYQVDLLNSDDYNDSLETIYNHLEALYEKTRLLQDIIAYLESYIKSAIESYTEECLALLDQIEDQRDSLKQYNAYSSINVPLTISLSQKLDRNGTKLQNTSTLNKCIVPKYIESEKYSFENCRKVSGFASYQNNLSENLVSNYRVFYSLDAPITDGLVEEIQLNFSAPKDVNIINIITANCTVDQIKYVCNNTIEPEDYVMALIKRTKKMNGFNLVLKCTNYTEKIYYFDETRKKTDCWNKISQNEYDVILGKANQYTQAEIDSLLGISAYQEAYAQYLREVELWKTTRQRIIDINISNGYTDTMESFDIISSPDVQGLNNYNVSTGRLENTTLAKNEKYFFTAEQSNNIKISEEALQKQINNFDNIFPSIEKYRYQTISSDKASMNKLYKK